MEKARRRFTEGSPGITPLMPSSEEVSDKSSWKRTVNTSQPSPVLRTMTINSLRFKVAPRVGAAAEGLDRPRGEVGWLYIKPVNLLVVSSQAACQKAQVGRVEVGGEVMLLV